MSRRADRSRIAVVRQGRFPSDPRVRKEVLALLEAGHEVDVICERHDAEPRVEEWRGSTVHRLQVNPRQGEGARGQLIEYAGFLRAAGVRLARLDRSRHFRLVQVNTLPDLLAWAAIFPRLRGAKVLLDMHELMPEFFAAKYGRSASAALTRVVRLAEWLATRPVDHVLFVSPLQAEIMARRVGRPYTVIPNAPDEELFASPAELREGEGPPIVMTHGTLAERYGPQLLIEALPAVLRTTEAEAWVVGGGEYLPALRRLAERLGVAEHVHFTGRIDLEEVPGVLARARIGVVPLLPDGYIELASPNKLFEYVALGRPTVSSDVPGIRTYFDERQTEFFQPGDAADLARKVVRLLGDRERSDELVGEASRLYDRLRWRVSSGRYLETVDRLLGAG